MPRYYQNLIGGRLLRKWLINPSTDLKQIELRHNIVEAFTKEKQLLKFFTKSLSVISDLQRILGKINKAKQLQEKYMLSQLL